jgi:hypothetical protein
MTYLAFITVVHTLLSIAAIPIGALAVIALFRPGALDWAMPWFLWFAGLTSITGFLFPFKGMTPAVWTGIVAILVLAMALLASRRFQLERVWRTIYAVALIASLYLLVFVGIVQAFLKIGFLHRLAPTGSELPFAIAQFYALTFFVSLGFMAVRRFQRQPGAASTRRRAGDLA